VTAAWKSGQFTLGETVKGQFLLRKPKESGRRGSCEKDLVSDRCGLGTWWAKGSALASEFDCSLTGKSSVAGGPTGSLRFYTGGEGVGKVPDITRTLDGRHGSIENQFSGLVDSPRKGGLGRSQCWLTDQKTRFVRNVNFNKN